MKSLQEYLLENIDEGKIWDSIKDWFKKLFEPSDREFDRYNPDNKISGINLNNYQKYLDENFDSKNLKLQQLDKKSLKTIVYPNGEEPNEDGEIGFYKFIDNVNISKDNTEYYGFIYDEKNAKDTACLINCKHNGNNIELLNIQVIKEFMTLFPIKNALKLLLSIKQFTQEANQVIFKETTDKTLYKQLINDCEFESQYDKENNTNIAIKNI